MGVGLAGRDRTYLNADVGAQNESLWLLSLLDLHVVSVAPSAIRNP